MSERKKIVVVGGVAGGASAAARARRLAEDAEITIFERGSYISFANCGLPYHIAGDIADRKSLLLQTPGSFLNRMNVDVRIRHEVVGIDRERREVVVRDLDRDREFRQPYDSLVLSPGAEPIRPPIAGIESDRVFTLRNMDDMDAVIHLLETKRPDSAAVVGGGYIGLEMVEALHRRGLKVTLVELADQVMAPADAEMAASLHQELLLQGVDLRLGVAAEEIRDDGDKLQVRLKSGETITCGLLLMAVGVRPEVALARQAGLEIGRLGGIAVDERMRTSDENIYAVGDAVEVRELVGGREALIPLAGPANRQGRIAADNICGRASTYRNTQGTAICKVFGQTIGMTGLGEKALKRAGIDYEKIYVHAQSHAGYYPGASPIHLKLLFSPGIGRILGAQAVGADGIDKRIDVLATAIRAGMSVFDLEHLELSYAPPYGSAKDAVNYAGFAAANFLRGDVAICHAEDVLKMGEGQMLLDVRSDAELAASRIPGAVHIPIDQLRGRLGELRRDREWLVFCQVGLRGYLACRILMQNGFKCRNLSGGLKTYLLATCTVEKLKQTLQGVQTADKAKGTNPMSNTNDKPDAMGRCAANVIKQIDARGLQCPGPIQKLKAAVDALAPGEAVRVTATDPGFLADVPAWCNTTGNELAEIGPEAGGAYQATVIKRAAATGEIAACCGSPAPQAVSRGASGKKGLTIVVFSNSFDRATAAFIIANGAAAMGFEVTLFFTFWGLNILRKDAPVSVKKNFIERMFGWMMPRGPEKLALSQMNMAGMGLAMIKGIMRKKNVAGLPESIRTAQESGVRLVACAMSMDLMGIKREELIDGVETGGVAMYLDRAGAGNVNLFI